MLEISGLTWAVTIGVVVVLLALDLVLAAARPHRVGFRARAIEEKAPHGSGEGGEPEAIGILHHSRSNRPPARRT